MNNIDERKLIINKNFIKEPYDTLLINEQELKVQFSINKDTNTFIIITKVYYNNNVFVRRNYINENERNDIFNEYIDFNIYSIVYYDIENIELEIYSKEYKNDYNKDVNVLFDRYFDEFVYNKRYNIIPEVYMNLISYSTED